MAYSTILVYISNDDQAERLVNVGKILARKSNAHLIGLHVIPVFRTNTRKTSRKNSRCPWQ